ncbi:hypothetical protein SAMN06265371_10788 [Lutibacter agarilyticus]|uniref:Uncharacterized protein n=1 Tax=Lutibacter agarilyticus TaxID=1109740 RepID=A0A238XUX9_9FLAO|nr:hypothetical protein SAMN06265371_10788 [Lutibacter agarilyticus]
MSNFNEILTFESKSAYDFAYDLSMKKNFSTPKIYTANGDLKKRWYVYFSFRNPKTGRLKRITPFYGDANKRTYYIRPDIKLRDLELHQLTLNYEKTTQKLQYII